MATINGSNADNTLNGGAAADVVNGNGGNDLINPGGGNDTVRAGDGNDFVIGSAGDDLIYGGEGNDTLTSHDGGGRDTLYGENGDDSLIGSNNAPVTLFGGAGNDSFNGGNRAEVLDGGEGDDFIYAGDGDDTIISGPGNDTMVGFTGSDTYRTDLSDGSHKEIWEDYGIPANSPSDILEVTTLGDPSYGRNGDDLIITDSESGGTLKVVGHFLPGNGVEVFVVNGVTYTDDEVELKTFAPVLNAPNPDQTALEDEAFTYTLPTNTFTDVDNSVITYTATLSDGSALPSWLTFDATTLTFSGTPGNQHVGALTLRVTASDDVGSASDSILLTIQNTNDAPTADQPLANQQADEDASFSYTIPATAFSDIDAGDTLTYSATLAGGAALPTWLTFDATTRTFSGVPAQEDVGTLSLRITATDGSGASAASTLLLAVANTNDAPVAALPLANQAVTEDSSFSYTLDAGSFTDVDGDALTLTATLTDGAPLPIWLSFNPATGTFSGIPDASAAALNIRVVATDPSGASAQSDFRINITTVNDAPVAALAIAPQVATEDSAFSLTLDANTFTDEDSTLTLSATLQDGAALPTWLTFDATTRTFSGTPENDHVGNIVVRVTATDGEFSTSSDFQLAVQNTNDAPVAAAAILDAQNATEDSEFTFSLPANAFTDVDAGDTLTLTATLANGDVLPSWLTFDAATGSFTGTPAESDVGDLMLRVTATDLAGATATSEFTLAVAGVNDAPIVVTPLIDLTATEDTAFAFTIPADAFIDEDAGDTLSYGVTLADGTALPSWLTFNAATRTLSGTPGEGEDSLFDIRVTATDTAGAHASSSFRLNVATVNDAPIVAAALLNQTASEGDAFTYTVPVDAFTDVDSTLTYTATLADGSALPTWLTFNETTRTFTGTPANGDAANLALRVTATDGEFSVSSDFTLEVENTNDAPVVAQAIADLTTAEDASFTYVIPTGTFTDADGDALSLTATLADGGTLPTWLSFNAATGTFSGTPTNDHVGSIALRVTATDAAGAHASSDFALKVTNTNDAPIVAATLADKVALEDTVFTYTLPANAFTDVDAGDSLTYSVTLADGTALPTWLTFNAATQTFSGTPTNSHVGTLALRVTATDTAGAHASSDFALKVENVNDAPVVSVALTGRVTAEDALFTYTIPANSFTDIDGDALTYSATLSSGAALPSWLTFDAASRTFSGTPTNDHVGNLVLRVTATDPSGASANSVFELRVNNTNDAPIVVTPLANRTVDEDAPLTFTLPAGSFKDVDAGDTLTYSATLASGAALPTWLTFNAATQTFTGTPLQAHVGALDIRVTATDTSGATASSSFRMNVANVNDKPVLAAALLDQSATSGKAFSYQFNATSFTDEDGDVLTYSAATANGGALPTWLTFDAATRSFSGTPTAGNVGDVTVYLTANDGKGGTITDNFLIKVIAGETAGLRLIGTSKKDTLTGGDGNDLIMGLSNSDSLVGGKGNDTIYAGSDGDDLLDKLLGIFFSDTLRGGDGNDVLYGSWGNDLLDGGAGNDTIYGSVGKDTLLGGDGNDSIRAGIIGCDSVDGGAGNDTLTGSLLNDGLYGGDGNDLIEGYTGEDKLLGGAGNDTLNGGWGADSLTGGAGVDLLTGDLGRDIFVFESATVSGKTAGTRDIITDFNRSEGDRIDLSALTGTLKFMGTKAFDGKAAEVNFVKVTADKVTLVQVDANGDGVLDMQIELKGLIDLTASDFLL